MGVIVCVIRFDCLRRHMDNHPLIILSQPLTTSHNLSQALTPVYSLSHTQETQTKPEGQIHFFPVLFNGKQLYDVMLERCGPTKTSGPK